MTQNILIIGAGRSTTSLINYLISRAEKYDWHITVADREADLIEEKVHKHPSATALTLDVTNTIQRTRAISQADIVVSMLPAHMHVPIAKDCIALGKHMVTASYISSEMRELDEEAKAAGVILMNEIGVDPGIDHMSAMRLIDDIKDKGGKILLFESFTGGLIAPESEGDNPWRYKFTWNPRNVVLAGAGGAVKFKQEGLYKYIPYHQLFRRTEFIDIEGFGRFEAYANRDSLKYRNEYGLQKIPTIYRGTLRRPGFCRAWDVFVKLGMTDDSYTLENSAEMTFSDFTNTFLAYSATDSVALKLMHYLQIPQDSDLMEKLTWIGLFDKTPIPLENATPAQILQYILMQKWTLKPEDKDMIVMFHKVGFELNGEQKMLESSMVTLGEDHKNTAMARTVGIPVAIATKLILQGKINTPGVHLPLSREIYEPMLNELASHNIAFVEKEVAFKSY